VRVAAHIAQHEVVQAAGLEAQPVRLEGMGAIRTAKLDRDDVRRLPREVAGGAGNVGKGEQGSGSQGAT
jgi:hypothetical protein